MISQLPEPLDRRFTGNFFMANEKLHHAKAAKNDEFYTQYADIQREMNAYLDFNPNVFRDKTVLLPCDDPEWSNFTKFFAQNFEAFGLKKLISTSFAAESKSYKTDWQPTLFERQNPAFDVDKTRIKGKIFTLTRGENAKADINALKWRYLDGDGDFRNAEVTKLRDEADIIITNPPFSLFRRFLEWIMEARKSFAIIANQNSVTYKEVFPLIKNNKIWLGKGFTGGASHFISNYQDYATASNHKDGMIRVSGIIWLTNLDHGRRHLPLTLMTTADNLKYSKHKEIRENGYQNYDNYGAIEVPFTDSIPSDYNGAMGVPISFLDKYNPEQFEIIGATESEGVGFSNGLWKAESRVAQPLVNGVKKYKRIFIRKRG